MIIALISTTVVSLCFAIHLFVLQVLPALLPRAISPEILPLATEITFTAWLWCTTSLGFGDVVPTENQRVIAAVEAFTGLVLITWTASFAFLAVQRLWGKREN